MINGVRTKVEVEAEERAERLERVASRVLGGLVVTGTESAEEIADKTVTLAKALIARLDAERPVIEAKPVVVPEPTPKPAPRPTGQLFLFRRNDILILTGISDTQFKRLVRAGKFPKPTMLGPRSPRWTREEVFAWIRKDSGASEAAPSNPHTTTFYDRH